MTTSEEVPESALVPTPPTVEELEKQVQEYKEKYLRALAEVENTRKRLTKEKIESQSFAVQNIVVDILQPLDHLEQAVHHADKASKEVSNWVIGFEMIIQQLKQALADHGILPFDSLGQAFDPHRHEAIETEEKEDSPEGTVVFEFQKGYTLSGRVIRPARVRVSTRCKEESDESNNPQE
jgi:molecular chaperone GrpE